MVERKSGDKRSFKERIASYAEKTFFERGFKKTSVEEICHGLGISKRTFYKYYTDKDALVREIVNGRFSEIKKIIHANLTGDEDAKTKIINHLGIIEKRFAKAFSVVFLNDVRILMPEIMDEIETFKAKEARMVAGLLKQGQKERTIRSGVDVDVFGRLLQGIVARITTPEFLMSQGLSMNQLINTLRDVILNGILERRQKKF